MTTRENTTPVDNELLRELKARAQEHDDARFGSVEEREAENVILGLVAMLPSPPPLDPVHECRLAYLTALDVSGTEGAMRAALRRFVALGCPEIPE